MRTELKITEQLAALRGRPNAEGSLAATFDVTTSDDVRSLARELSAPGGAANALSAVGVELKQLDFRHRAASIVPTLRIYAVALYLRESDDAWTDFCRRKEWASFRGAKPSPATQARALRYAFRYAYGFDDPSITKRASKDAKMLERAFDRGLTPAEVAQEISRAGGREAYSLLQQQSRAAIDLASSDIIVRLTEGDCRERLLVAAAGRRAKLVLEIQYVDGRTVHARARKLAFLKADQKP